MLVKSLPQNGFPQVSNQPFDLILDDWNVAQRRYATIPLPNGTLPLFIKPPQKEDTAFQEQRAYDIHYYGQLRPDTFNFAWNAHTVTLIETYRRDNSYHCYIAAYPLLERGEHNAAYWGCTKNELHQFQADLLALGEQWLARERRRQAAGLQATWLYNNIRMTSPTTQDWQLWKCPWHPRTLGVEIAAEYPPDWIGAEPIDHYNNYRQFRRITNNLWTGPNNVTIKLVWAWKIDPPPNSHSDKEEFSNPKLAIDAYWSAENKA